MLPTTTNVRMRGKIWLFFVSFGFCFFENIVRVLVMAGPRKSDGKQDMMSYLKADEGAIFGRFLFSEFGAKMKCSRLLSS